MKPTLEQSINCETISTALNVLKDSGGCETTICASTAESAANLVSAAHRSYRSDVEGYQKSAKAECRTIHELLKSGFPHYGEIRLDQMQHYTSQSRLPLGDTCIRLRFSGDTGESLTIFLPKESSLPARIFINGEKNLGFLALPEEGGQDFIVPLDFFHLFSINEHSRPERELAVVTSFLSYGSFYSSPIMAKELKVIQQILLADWLQSVDKSYLLKTSDAQVLEQEGEHNNGQ